METDDTFELSSSYDLEQRLREGFAGVQGDGKLHNVEIRFAKSVAEIALERPWSEEQTFRCDRQGRIVISFRTDALFQVMRQVLQWGEEIEVLKPKLLREWMRETASRLAKLYR